MTKITIFKKHDLTCAYQVKGHSGFAEVGSDIVCSAISTATQMTLAGLKELLNLQVLEEIREGYLRVEILGDDFNKCCVQVLLNTMQITLQQISKEYASYVKMEVKKDVY